MTDRVSAEGLREARDPYFEPDFRLRAWAGCVQRLIAVAPIKAVLDETGAGFSGGGHSTPPERKAIRDAAAQVVDGWLARDLAALRDTGPRPDSDRLREAADALLGEYANTHGPDGYAGGWPQVYRDLEAALRDTGPRPDSVHVNTGEAEARAMAWSQGHTDGYNEALADTGPRPDSDPVTCGVCGAYVANGVQVHFLCLERDTGSRPDSDAVLLANAILGGSSYLPHREAAERILARDTAYGDSRS